MPSSSPREALTGPIPRSEEMLLRVHRCETSQMDITLCYQAFGDPQDGRPAVLLVGGLNMQLTAWDEDFCDDLVRAGFFVVRYDNRDIGYSTKVEDRGSVVGPRLLLPKSWAAALGERLPYTIDDMAKDGLALLEAMHIPRAHLVAVSMGGMIAQCMALLRPESVMSIASIMSSTNPPDLPDGQLWVKFWMLRKPPAKCTVDQLLDFRVNSLKKLLEHALPVDGEYLKRRFLLSLNRSSYGAGLIRQAAVVLRCPPREEALRSLTIPVLVVHGAQDLVVPSVHGYRTAQIIPHSRLLVFKSMGHYFHPAFFRSIIAAFTDMASTTLGPGYSLASDELLFSTKSPTTPGVPSAAAQNGSSAKGPMMSSIAPMLRPVVTTPDTKTGAAAVRAVNTAVPVSGDPSLPEAILLDLHATAASSPTPSPSPSPEAAPVPDTLPYTVGSPSTWNAASFPSPVRKTATGGFVVDTAAAVKAAEELRQRTTMMIPVLAGTPLDVFLASDKATGTEATGGRRSRLHSRCPSFDMSSIGTSNAGASQYGLYGLGVSPPHLAGGGSSSATLEPGDSLGSVHPGDPASIEDVASTLMPPQLPHDLSALPETIV